MIIVEMDKAGAEWVIVAFLSGDENMLDVVHSGESPHTRTATLISGAPAELILEEDKAVGQNTNPELIAELREPLGIDEAYYLPRSSSIRQAAKKCNHGLNYGMGHSRFALENEIMETEAKELVGLYHHAYPGLKIWHENIQRQLRENRTLVNCFGRKRRFLDAWGPKLFDAAYSFLPQSTTWDIIRRGIIRCYFNSEDRYRPWELLVETHDSMTFQYPEDRLDDLGVVIKEIKDDHLNPTLQYRARQFTIGTTAKIGYDLGTMEDINIEGDATSVTNNLKKAMEKLRDEAKARGLAS